MRREAFLLRHFAGRDRRKFVSGHRRFLATIIRDPILMRRAVTTDTALRLGRYFGTSPEFWINLQARSDLDVADRTGRRPHEQEGQPRAA